MQMSTGFDRTEYFKTRVSTYSEDIRLASYIGILVVALLTIGINSGGTVLLLQMLAIAMFSFAIILSLFTKWNTMELFRIVKTVRIGSNPNTEYDSPKYKRNNVSIQASFALSTLTVLAGFTFILWILATSFLVNSGVHGYLATSALLVAIIVPSIFLLGVFTMVPYIIK
mmetsp:Transcript_19732/g.27521  ORF Transcript_19732/g.27521 Transcript_19732/m.27521 type:complete len:170 (-) Transcript_19732:23-532(-)